MWRMKWENLIGWRGAFKFKLDLEKRQGKAVSENNRVFQKQFKALFLFYKTHKQQSNFWPEHSESAKHCNGGTLLILIV